MNQDEKNIRELLERRDRAFADKDAGAMVATLAQDFVSYDFAPPLANRASQASGTEGLSEWLDSWDGSPKLESGELEITISSDLALVHGLRRMSGKKKDGEVVDLWHRSTTAWRKTAASWELFHEHNSVPFAMDGSFRALTDLKP